MKHFIKDWLFCGVCGLITEIVFTAIGSAREHRYDLKGVTSLWMFPIYATAAILHPISVILKKLHLRRILRGLVYMLCIFTTEYTSGRLLSKKKRCPWSYYCSDKHINGVVRLDYAPYWFAYGLGIEAVLARRHKER